MPGKAFIQLLILSIFISGCGVQESSTNENHKDSQEMKREKGVQGSWRWIETHFVSTIQGAESEKLTPESSGIDMEVTFKKDTVIVYHNGNPKAKYGYQVVKPSENKKFLQVKYKGNYTEPGLQEGPIHLYNDTLQIMGSANDAGGDQKLRRLK